ncbi:NADH-ubiquinone oxidoreductase-F iron-sulfur binding region domain-containing protein [Pseudonocardia acidicola]|uniref:NADH-quinone oxidoreductase subunit F n=1 Tax=Pseudonocardia acidicola TaxID=2724939 RepID=A0ABX1S817_9PSEU|nr:NADH-ubiquinone oxidoreductase-F iron-sulfur binding region domain-containing protein [Pseudonocardia acidicola]NMH97691.1 NADH-quinone oxidoreductase subunit F [Pseudonocardia acidicola]
MTAVLDPAGAAAIGGRRLLAAAEADLDAHLRRSGPVPWRGAPGALLAELEAAGLTGRGGAGFPAWRKLAAVAEGKEPVVVANGAEGEPASAKDRTLLRRGPHLVLDGLQLAAEAAGAVRAHLYVAPATFDTALAALSRRREAGVDRVAVEVVEAPEAFLSGEESAVVARLSGRAALPADKARRVVESGVRGRPTAVQNVETLAHLALIARYGPAWFRAAGTPAEPGTMLVTRSGAVPAPGVDEVAHGTPLPAVLGHYGGVTGPVLVGGYHGAWLAPHEVAAARLSRACLQRFGATPGAGVLFALPPGRCGLAETARITGYLAAQSARQCGPCRNGLPRMAETLSRLAGGARDPRLVAQVHRMTALVAGRGACHHPDGTAALVRSALRVFAGDVDAHLAGRCLARRADRRAMTRDTGGTNR